MKKIHRFTAALCAAIVCLPLSLATACGFTGDSSQSDSSPSISDSVLFPSESETSVLDGSPDLAESDGQNRRTPTENDENRETDESSFIPRPRPRGPRHRRPDCSDCPRPHRPAPWTKPPLPDFQTESADGGTDKNSSSANDLSSPAPAGPTEKDTSDDGNSSKSAKPPKFSPRFPRKRRNASPKPNKLPKGSDATKEETQSGR